MFVKTLSEKIIRLNALQTSSNLFKSSNFHNQKCSASTSVASDLYGRDLVSIENYSTSDIHTLLWIALDLKNRKSEQKICAGKSICMISDNPMRQISLNNAAVKIGASAASIGLSSLTNNESLDFEMLGKTLASAADIVFVDSNNLSQNDTEKLATGCTVPLVCVQNSEQSPVICLTELMTLFEHYQYLRRLIVSFIGNATDPKTNTYSHLLPKVGMHLHYLIDGQINGSIWERSMKLSVLHNTEFKQFDNLADNLYRTHVLSTSPHKFNEFQLTLKDTEEMDLDWTLFHSDVYKGASVPREMLWCKQSLIWKELSNLTWIFQALVASKTMRYKPSIVRPGFEGIT